MWRSKNKSWIAENNKGLSSISCLSECFEANLLQYPFLHHLEKFAIILSLISIRSTEELALVHLQLCLISVPLQKRYIPAINFTNKQVGLCVLSKASHACVHRHEQFGRGCYISMIIPSAYWSLSKWGILLEYGWIRDVSINAGVGIMIAPPYGIVLTSSIVFQMLIFGCIWISYSYTSIAYLLQCLLL